MRFIVGSKNPAKLEALREILRDYPHLADSEVIGKEVSSGVSEQPKSLEETITGALTRAKGAFVDCDYGVGIESGLVPIPQARTGYLELTAVAIWDGRWTHLGLSPAFECPAEVMRLVLEDGLSLNDAVYHAGVTTNPHVGSAEGIIGILTKGRMTRKQYTAYALRTALIHLDR